MPWTVVFYETARGEKPVAEFLRELSEELRAKCVAYLKKLEEHGNRLPANFARHLEGDLWELRPEFGGTEYRLFYFTFVEQQIVVLHAVVKKRQKMRRADLDTATARIAEVRRRHDEEQQKRQKER